MRTGARIGPARTIFGPPRSRGETIICTVGSALVIALLTGYIVCVGGWQGWSVPQVGVLALVIFDLIFGMFTISTTTAKRWYHRAGVDAHRLRAGFVLGHLPYLLVGAALFHTGWWWAAVNAGMLLGAALLVDTTPRDLKRIVALALTLTAALVNLIWLPLPAALAWLPVLLFVKILMCFLLPEQSTAAPAAAVAGSR